MQKSYTQAWYRRDTNINADKKVIVIGGGISGATTAYSLASRGYDVTIYEKRHALAMEASGNYQAVLYGHFGGNPSPELELTIKGYQYSHDLITRLPKDSYGICGIIEPIDSDYRLKQIMRNNYPIDFCYPITQKQISQVAGIKLNIESGMYYPSGLWLNPKALIDYLTNHPNIKIVCNSLVNDIDYTNKWQVITQNGIIDSSYHLVLCNSYNLKEFTYTKNLPLNKTRGQTTIVKGNLGLKTIICGNGYITPNLLDAYTIGATFNKDISNLEATKREHIENISKIAKYIADCKIDLKYVTGDANIRMHSLPQLTN